MSTRENIFAFTEPTGYYPGFISINRQGDGRISVTVRSTGSPTGSASPAEIDLRPDQARELAHSILSDVR